MFYLKGRPLDVPVEAGVSNIPGLDSDKALISKDKLKFMREDERGSSRKEKRRKGEYMVLVCLLRLKRLNVNPSRKQ